MSYEHNDMTGTIFKNTFKQEGDKAPDYRGNVKVRGELLEIALWVKDGTKGKFFSAKIQEPRQKAASIPPPRTARPSLKDELSDDIPF
jgi:hypothetical protein